MRTHTFIHTYVHTYTCMHITVIYMVVDLNCFIPEWPSSRKKIIFRATVAELSRRHIYIPLQARLLIPLRVLLRVPLSVLFKACCEVALKRLFAGFFWGFVNASEASSKTPKTAWSSSTEALKFVGKAPRNSQSIMPTMSIGGWPWSGFVDVNATYAELTR